MEFHIILVLLTFGSLTNTVVESRTLNTKEGSVSNPPVVSRMQTVTVSITVIKLTPTPNSLCEHEVDGKVNATLRWCLQPLNIKSDKWPQDDNCLLGEVDEPFTVGCADGSLTRNELLSRQQTTIKIRDTPSYEGFTLLALIEKANSPTKGYSTKQDFKCDSAQTHNLTDESHDDRITTTINVTCVDRVLDRFDVIGGLDGNTVSSKVYRYSFNTTTHIPKHIGSFELPNTLSPTARFTKINDSHILISGGCSVESGCMDRVASVFIGELSANPSDFNKSLVEMDSLDWPISDHFVVVDGHILILCGGMRENNDLGIQQTVNKCHQLDSSKNTSTWQPWFNMTLARNGLAVLNLNGELFAISGQDGEGKLLSSVEWIAVDGTDGKWTFFDGSFDQAFPNQALMNSAQISSEEIIMCGGIETTTENKTDHCFILHNGKLDLSIDDSLESDLNEPRKQGGLLHTGDGLLAFGGGTNSFEYYNNATGLWNVIKNVIMNGTAPSQFGVIAWYRDVKEKI